MELPLYSGSRHLGKGVVVLMKVILFDFLMFIFTFFIAWGCIGSFKARNKFAIGFGVVSLVVFLFADGLIIYYATKAAA